MSPSVVVFKAMGHKRSELIADAMFAGICARRERVVMRSTKSHVAADADVAVFYGLHRQIMDDYRAAGKVAIYVDLGYWGRHDGGRRAGYHKLAVNSRHPTAYFQNHSHLPTRFAKHGVEIKGWRKRGKHILLAGMSDKAAKAEGFTAQQWEAGIVNEIRRHTDRAIVYRPKPNWPDARVIRGTTMDRTSDLAGLLFDCHAVVTHHSNVAIDALMEGVPVFCWDGVATPLALGRAEMIEEPAFPEDRFRFACDVAWTQWNVEEMRNGDAWKYIRDEGLV